MKKFITLLLAVVTAATCCFAFAACNPGEKKTEKTKVGLIVQSDETDFGFFGFFLTGVACGKREAAGSCRYYGEQKCDKFFHYKKYLRTLSGNYNLVSSSLSLGCKSYSVVAEDYLSVFHALDNRKREKIDALFAERVTAALENLFRLRRSFRRGWLSPDPRCREARLRRYPRQGSRRLSERLNSVADIPWAGI